jgi:hypothetical protein
VAPRSRVEEKPIALRPPISLGVFMDFAPKRNVAPPDESLAIPKARHRNTKDGAQERKVKIQREFPLQGNTSMNDGEYESKSRRRRNPEKL